MFSFGVLVSADSGSSELMSRGVNVCMKHTDPPSQLPASWPETYKILRIAPVKSNSHNTLTW